MLEIIDPAALGMQPLDMSGILAARAEAEAKCKGCEAYRPEPQLSGNLQCDPEISLLSPGFPVEVGYYYNASSGVNGPFGFGRTISPNLTAQASGSPMLVTLTRDNGAQVSYAYSSGTGGYVAQTPGVLNTLTQDTADSLWKETTLDGMVTAYPLDTAGHITSAAYIQDAVGNTHSHIYSSGLLQNIQDPAGRLVTFGWSGGLLQSIEDWAARRTTFLYNTTSASPLNLLTTVTGPTGCQTGYQYATYTQFSPSGVYSSKWLMSGIVSPNGYGTSYLYDMQSRVINRAIQGVGTYLYSPGFMTTIDPMGGILTQAVGGDFQLNSVQDQLGNITTYTRNANLQETSRQSPTGSITDAYSSTAFGEPLQTGSGTVNPHRYVGLQRYRQQTNGFYLLSLRVLNPFTGQFTSVDPIGFDGGYANLYVYVGNNPIVLFDPTGLDLSRGQVQNGNTLCQGVHGSGWHICTGSQWSACLATCGKNGVDYCCSNNTSLPSAGNGCKCLKGPAPQKGSGSGSSSNGGQGTGPDYPPNRPGSGWSPPCKCGCGGEPWGGCLCGWPKRKPYPQPVMTPPTLGFCTTVSDRQHSAIVAV